MTAVAPAVVQWIRGAPSAALPAANRSLPLHVQFANDAAVFVIFFSWQIGRARAIYSDGKSSLRDYGRVRNVTL